MGQVLDLVAAFAQRRAGRRHRRQVLALATWGARSVGLEDDPVLGRAARRGREIGEVGAKAPGGEPVDIGAVDVHPVSSGRERIVTNPDEDDVAAIRREVGVVVLEGAVDARLG